MDEATYNHYWDIWCRRYDPQQQEIANIRKLVSLRGKRVLEIGCGDGRLTRQLARYADTVVGIDKDVRLVASARAQETRENIRYVVQDLMESEWEDEFDIVIFAWSLVLMHGKEREALKRAKKALKDHGQVVLTEPAEDSDYSAIVEPFVQSSPLNIDESYEQPLREVFGQPFTRRGPIEVAYRFASLQEAFEVFRFAIEQWHETPLNEPQQLWEVLKTYREQQIYERLLFYSVHK